MLSLSDAEKFALLAEYDQAKSRRQGQTWLKQRNLTTARISEWRTLKDIYQLPTSDPRLFSGRHIFSEEQKASLIREYQEAASRGEGEAWLTERNLTQGWMTRWQTLLQSRQSQARQPTPPGGPGVGTEPFDPDSYFGPLFAAAADQGASGSSSVPPGQIEIGIDPEEEFPQDDLYPAQTRYSREDELALLADYEQALSQGQGKSWLQQRDLTTSQMYMWRKRRTTSQLPAGDPRLATATKYLSPEQKTALAREYLAAVSQGEGEAWLTERNLTKAHLTRWLPGTVGQGGPTREQRLAMVDEYEQAKSQRQGKAWLEQHGLTKKRISEWRKLRPTDHSGPVDD
jgi:hypothetical protein